MYVRSWSMIFDKCNHHHNQAIEQLPRFSNPCIIILIGGLSSPPHPPSPCSVSAPTKPPSEFCFLHHLEASEVVLLVCLLSGLWLSQCTCPSPSGF